jgi:hypothetical protein
LTARTDAAVETAEVTAAEVSAADVTAAEAAAAEVAAAAEAAAAVEATAAAGGAAKAAADAPGARAALAPELPYELPKEPCGGADGMADDAEKLPVGPSRETFHRFSLTVAGESGSAGPD